MEAFKIQINKIYAQHQSLRRQMRHWSTKITRKARQEANKDCAPPLLCTLANLQVQGLRGWGKGTLRGRTAHFLDMEIVTNLTGKK